MNSIQTDSPSHRLRPSGPAAFSSARTSNSPSVSSEGSHSAEDIFEWYAGFEVSAQTRVRAQSNGSSTDAPLPSSRAKKSPDTGHPAPRRGIWYRCVWQFWHLSLVKPLQLTVATLGIAAGVITVACEATSNILLHLGVTLYRTFWAAFERVREPAPFRPERHHRQRPASASAGDAALADGSPLLPSPDLGGRTPSAMSSLALSGGGATPPPSAPSHASTAASSPLAMPAQSRPSTTTFDARPHGLPAGRLVTLPDAICSTCGEVVGPNQACAHLANERADA